MGYEKTSKFIKVSVSEKKKWVCLFPTEIKVSKLKIVVLSSKPPFFHEGHKSTKIVKTIKNIIINHLKSFFQEFWVPLSTIGWINERFPKKSFWLKIWSFWQKFVIFHWKFFWPHPFFGRKQTNCRKISAEHQKYPKSWPKNFL